MHAILRRFDFINAIALVALCAGCSSMQTQTQSKENLLIAAGFQVLKDQIDRLHIGGGGG
jgi:outer membrane protein assembly factor BamE (lipoprotein component of BamABCDE complex)